MTAMITTTKFEAFLARKGREFGERFDRSALDPRFVSAYNTGLRIRVRSSHGEEKTGTVGVTTGWKPVFILLANSRSRNSGDVLGPGDRITAVKFGRGYIPHIEDIYKPHLTITGPIDRAMPEEVVAFEDYVRWAVMQGLDWRQELLNDWMTAGERTAWPRGRRGCGDWCYLQRMRNQLGLSWLAEIKVEVTKWV